jgi:integrase
MTPMETYRMTVFRPARRRNYVIRWKDPLTHATRERTAGTPHKRAAYQVAAQLAADLQARQFKAEYGWAEFCFRYEQEHLTALSGSSLTAWRTICKTIRQHSLPVTIGQVNASYITRWQRFLRAHGLGEVSIGTYTARLGAALRWAADQDILAAAPKIRIPKRAKGKSKMARSRGITEEEYERILLAVPKIRPADAARWRRFIQGLWMSGFRIEELLRLSWDSAAEWSIDCTGNIPVVRIAGDAQKSGEDQYQPITPDFWALCSESPQRTGPVFLLPGQRGQMTVKRVCRIISQIGRRAGVVTDAATGKCATSHDIGRRAFTVRMAGRLSLPDLQKWMRHASVTTTLNYYHHRTAEELGAKLWQPKSGALSGNHPSVGPAGKPVVEGTRDRKSKLSKS